MSESSFYSNPWHKPGRPEYGPAMYETAAKAVEYRGALIFERVAGHVWDVVVRGACITQMAGPKGARRFIDNNCASWKANEPSQNISRASARIQAAQGRARGN